VQYGQGYISALKSFVMGCLQLTRSGKSSLADPHSESSQVSRILALGITLPATRPITGHDYSTSFQILDLRKEQETINWGSLACSIL
jgi:hypothetical protein